MKPFNSFVNNYKFNDIMNNINYRVKWAMGNWYNKAQIITLPNGLYFSNDYSKYEKWFDTLSLFCLFNSFL